MKAAMTSSDQTAATPGGTIGHALGGREGGSPVRDERGSTLGYSTERNGSGLTRWWGALSGGQRTLVIVVALYTLAAFIYSAATRNLEFVYYSLWLVVFAAGIMWMHARVRIPTLLLMGLALWGAVHLLGGTVPVAERWLDPGETNRTLYNVRISPWLPKYDQVVHTYGFFISTLCAWAGLRATYPRATRPGFGVLLVLALTGMGLGAMNEVIEFVGTLVFPNTNVGGYRNTGWDLVCNMTGATLGAVVVYGWARQTARAHAGAA